MLTVDASVGVYDDRGKLGIGIDLGWYGLKAQDHWDFLFAMLTAGGFQAPRSVRFERTDTAKGKINWNSLRIPGDVCEVAQVDARVGAQRIRSWLRSDVPLTRWELTFKVPEPVDA